MMKSIRQGSLRSLLSMVLCAAVALAAGSAAHSADHVDAPGLMPPGGDLALDITDVFAFASPTCGDCTVLAMAVNPLSEAGVYAGFKKGADYEFRIDTNGDAIRDITFKATFSKVKKDGTQKMAVRMRHPDRNLKNNIIKRRDGRTTAIGEAADINNGQQGIRVFAGMTDDPFYFDLASFLDLSFCDVDPAPDFLAGTNVSMIALEIPNSVLAIDGPTIGVWGETQRKGERVDRMGRPAINTVLIPTNPINGADSRKTAFNQGNPASDFDDFGQTAIDTLMLLGNDEDTASGLAAFLLPDILTVNVDEPTNYPNGRNPADDIIDISLGLVTGGAIPSDCVDENDVQFTNEFPFFGEAQ